MDFSLESPHWCRLCGQPLLSSLPSILCLPPFQLTHRPKTFSLAYSRASLGWTMEDSCRAGYFPLSLHNCELELVLSGQEELRSESPLNSSCSQLCDAHTWPWETGMPVLHFCLDAIRSSFLFWRFLRGKCLAMLYGFCRASMKHVEWFPGVPLPFPCTLDFQGRPGWPSILLLLFMYQQVSI